MLRGEIYTLQQSVKKTPKRPDDSYFPLSFSIDSTKRLCFFQRSAHDIHLIFLSSARFSLSPLFCPLPHTQSDEPGIVLMLISTELVARDQSEHRTVRLTGTG